MASTYTTSLGIEKPATGEQQGSWGGTVNTNSDMYDDAIVGYVSVTLASAGTSGSPNTCAITDGAVSNGRNRYIKFTDGGDLGGNVFVQLTPNDAEKIGWVENALSGSQDLYVFQGTYNASNDYVIPAGQRALLRFDGAGSGAVVTNVFDNVRVEDLVYAGNLAVGGTLGVTGATTLSSTLGVTGATTLTGGLAGNPAVNTGNLVITTAGKGIDFSSNTGTAATGATTTSELLDFYEEGSWTPVIADSSHSSGEGQTYDIQKGDFVRVGRIVHWSFDIDVTAIGTLSGALFVDGLPYTSNSSGAGGAAAVGFSTGFLIDDESSISGHVYPNQAYVTLYLWNSAFQASSFAASNIVVSGGGEAVFRLTGSGFYLV